MTPILLKLLFDTKFVQGEISLNLPLLYEDDVLTCGYEHLSCFTHDETEPSLFASVYPITDINKIQKPLRATGAEISCQTNNLWSMCNIQRKEQEEEARRACKSLMLWSISVLKNLQS